MRPVVPTPGDLVEASWAGDVIDYAGSRLRYVPVPMIAGSLTGRTVPASTTDKEAELTELPANDATIAFAAVQATVRSPDTVSHTLNLYHGDGSGGAALLGSSGVASRGGTGPVSLVKVGGTNRRSILYRTSATTSLAYIVAVGYWVRESAEPAAGDDAVLPFHRLTHPPAAGEEMTTDWAEALLATAGLGWEMEVVPRGSKVIASGTQVAGGAIQTFNLSALLPDDDRIVAVAVDILTRHTDGGNYVTTLFHHDGNVAGYCYSQGVASRYGATGPWVVEIGPERSMKASNTGTAAQTTNADLNIVGIWRRGAKR